jgi:hypothetical protein
MSKRRLFLALLLLVSLDCLSSDLHKNAKLEIRLDQTLGSDISQAGQTFTATLNRSVSVGERNVLQKGARIEGRVEDASSTLQYSRPGQLELVLTSVTSSGEIIRISTNTLRFQGKERRIDPSTGKQDDRGARAEDITRAGIGVVGAGNTNAGHTIPGTDISVAPSTPARGMQVILPIKTKLVFTVTSSN